MLSLNLQNLVCFLDNPEESMELGKKESESKRVDEAKRKQTRLKIQT